MNTPSLPAVLAVNKFHYRFSGVETYHLGLIDLLEQRGHRVAAFAMRHPRNEPSPWARFFVSQVDYADPRPSARLRAAARALYSLEARRKLGALLAEFRPDIAHLQHIYRQLSPSVLDVLAAHDVPVVQTVHDYWMVCPSRQLYLYSRQEMCYRCKGGKFHQAARHRCVQYGWLASALAALEAYLARWMRIYQRRVKLFVVPSEFLRQKLIEGGIPAERTLRLPYFIAAVQYSPTFEGQGVLYLGRLEVEKGPTVLIESARALSNVSFQIAGSGRLEVMLRRRAAQLGNVRFMGQLTPEGARRALQTARLVVLPSTCHDVAPLVLLEAFASGKPVVASAVGGIPEIVRHGETGLLVPPNDAAALAEAIAALYHDPARCAAMGRAARDYVARAHDPQRHYEALMAIYQAAREGRPAPTLEPAYPYGG
ncbi:MAG: glycosyl transferase [Candidatus Roseilinea sp.]|nr:MAG: glycosyl transferase [Candidatus Roseilinea sp.]